MSRGVPSRQYAVLAPVYDLVSLEWPVYRSGRVAGVRALGLREGQTVLDAGCGTGLSLPLLAEGVGPGGHVVGVDASPAMLRGAHRRTVPARRSLLRADVTTLTRRRLDEAGLAGLPHAALFCYSLSLMRPWQQAWHAVTSLLPEGGRVAVVDMAVPHRGGPVARWAARAATWAGGADIVAHPWQALARSCVDVTSEQHRGGHLQVWAGTWTGRHRILRP